LKKCSKCKADKEFSEFAKASNRPDGLQCWCRMCSNEAMRVNRLENIETRREYDRNYSKNNRQKKTKNFREWRHNHPEKAKASNKRHYSSQRKWLKNNPNLTAHHAAKRRVDKKQATLPWVDLEHLLKIKEIYKSARVSSEFHEIPFHVDHIEPLKGVNKQGEHISCGLHVHWNLQSIPAEENLKKSNKLKQ